MHTPTLIYKKKMKPPHCFHFSFQSRFIMASIKSINTLSTQKPYVCPLKNAPIVVELAWESMFNSKVYDIGIYKTYQLNASFNVVH